MFAIRRVIFYHFAISFFPGVKLHVFGQSFRQAAYLRFLRNENE